MTVSSVISTIVNPDASNISMGMEKDFKFLQSHLKTCQNLESEQKSSSLHHDEVITKIAQMLKESNYIHMTYELESIQKRLTVIQSLRKQNSVQNLALDYFGLANRIRYLSYQYFPETMPTKDISYKGNLNSSLESANFAKLERLFFSDDTLTTHPLTLSGHTSELIKRANNPRFRAERQSAAIQCLQYFFRAGIGIQTGLKDTIDMNHPTNKEKIVTKLLEYGADPNESFWNLINSRLPPLAYWITLLATKITLSESRTSIRKIVQELLNHGMDVQVSMDPSNPFSLSSIHLAIGGERWDLITIYIYNSITIPTIKYDAGGSTLIGKAKAIYAGALSALSKSQVTYFQSQSILEALPTVILHLVAEYFLDKKTIAEQCYLVEEEDNTKNNP